MKQDEMRQMLIDSAVRIVARNGIHRTTTKAISKDSGINEVYIYRVFEDKDDLFEKAFRDLDEELVACIMQHVPIMDDREVQLNDRCWLFFRKCWEFLLGNREKCSFYIKYYHSQYFDSYPIEMRKQIFRPVLERFTPAFKEGIDVWMLFNHIMDVVFAGVLKVLRDESLNTVEMESSVYDLLYHSIRPYLSWTEQETELRCRIG